MWSVHSTINQNRKWLSTSSHNPSDLSQRYANADLKILQYLCLHMEIICWRFHIKTPFTFWNMCSWDMWKVCLQILRNNRIRQKLAYFSRSLQTSRANNLITLRIDKAKFSGYYTQTHEHTAHKQQENCQICISVPLKLKLRCWFRIILENYLLMTKL